MFSEKSLAMLEASKQNGFCTRSCDVRLVVEDRKVRLTPILAPRMLAGYFLFA